MIIDNDHAEIIAKEAVNQLLPNKYNITEAIHTYDDKWDKEQQTHLSIDIVISTKERGYDRNEFVQKVIQPAMFTFKNKLLGLKKEHISGIPDICLDKINAYAIKDNLAVKVTKEYNMRRMVILLKIEMFLLEKE
jgi:hypothetical protein